jgi:hypothetical protein
MSIYVSYTQQDDKVLDRMYTKDSILARATSEVLKSNVVAKEVRNVLFRNIYSRSTYNEENEFDKEIERLKRFDNKKIDTIIYRQVNVFGENVYDTTSLSNSFELFLSKKIHANTKQKIIKNRYMLLSSGQYFSPYLAYENARLIRSSGVFHDVRISPIINPKDTNHITLIVSIQDAFPYGFTFSPNSPTRIEFGVENRNLFGNLHQLSTNYKIDTRNPNHTVGYRLDYRIPNIIKRSFFDAFASYQNYALDRSIRFGIIREFIKPEMRWAGGITSEYIDQSKDKSNRDLVRFQRLNQQAWVSHAFPFRSQNTTIHAIITGVKFSKIDHISRPGVTIDSNFSFWNTNLALYSLGFSRVRFVQDRLLNGFGRTEDIPIGLSINGVAGLDYTEFGLRNYYGFQLLNRYYNQKSNYISIHARLGMYSRQNALSQGVFDFNFQLATRAFHLGSFRLRNFFNTRGTIGINHDSTDFITLSPDNGIRGLNNFDYRGNHRFTMSFQSNLFLPISVAGFRFSIFGLLELAKINNDVNSFFQTPLRSGATIGLAVKNENLIFDMLQFQYGRYPSTSNLNQSGFLITTILPFRFQNMDISKPNQVVYE